MSIRRILPALLCLLLFLPARAAAQSDERDLEIWAYIVRQGQTQFEQFVQSRGKADPGAWKGPIESSFLRLARSSGERGFNITYAVVKDQSFNAACYPGGQFVIHEGLLSILDYLIEQGTGRPVGKLDSKVLASARESLLAAVLAHELGHYYNRHAFRTFKQIWSLAEDAKQNVDLAIIRYSQEHEFEADRTGFLLMRSAGYDTAGMLAILGLLNSIQQANLRIGPPDAFNVFLTTHPSPHARLAAFEGDHQAMHAWAAALERAFSDIQLGRNLPQAVQVIEESLKAVPGNVHLRKAKSVALHKMWLQTVQLRDQQLRGILDMPAFRDDMVFSTLGTRGVRKTIPGDRALYMKAKEAYLATVKDAADPGYISNLALLLAYSPEPEEERLAVKLGAAAVQSNATIANVSNLAVVFHLVGMTDQAIELLGGVALEFDKGYASAIRAAESDPAVLSSLRAFHQEMRLTQALNREYVHSDFTPLLNLSLCLAYKKDLKQAKEIAQIYLRNYENYSAWAVYLAKSTGAEAPAQEARSPVAVAGIATGQSIDRALTAWGKPQNIASYKDGLEVWDYRERNVKLHIQGGVIDIIEMTSPESPKMDGNLGVGATRKDIERIFGPPRRTAAPYTVYEGKQNLAVQYSGDVAAVLLLFQ